MMTCPAMIRSPTPRGHLIFKNHSVIIARTSRLLITQIRHIRLALQTCGRAVLHLQAGANPAIQADVNASAEPIHLAGVIREGGSTDFGIDGGHIPQRGFGVQAGVEAGVENDALVVGAGHAESVAGFVALSFLGRLADDGDGFLAAADGAACGPEVAGGVKGVAEGDNFGELVGEAFLLGDVEFWEVERGVGIG